MQVAVGSSSMDASHVCTLVYALVGMRKTSPAQVAANAHCKCMQVRSSSCNACIQYMRHCLRKKTTTTAITQCKLQCCVQSPLSPPPPQHKLQCMHLVYAPLLEGKKRPPVQVTVCLAQHKHPSEGQKLHHHCWRA